MSTGTATSGPVVQAPDGRVSGVRLDSGVQRFLGIPYACLLYTSPSPRD